MTRHFKDVFLLEHERVFEWQESEMEQIRPITYDVQLMVCC